jgi:hypothetical protein
MARSGFALLSLLLGATAMAGSGEKLKDLDVGSYAELAVRPNPDQLILQYIPSLAAILLSVEKKLGSPLTEKQVEALRDKASVMAFKPNAAKAAEDRRGYRDIDPTHAWEEWQRLRLQFQQ